MKAEFRLTPLRTIAIAIGFSMFAGSVPAAAQSETVIYTFQGGADGATPEYGVIADSAGNLYGSTNYGGGGNCTQPSNTGCGTVFQLTPPSTPGGAWKETILYAFQGGVDGYFPNGLYLDRQGNLYSTTVTGGNLGNCPSGCGTIFELSPPATPGGAWTKTLLYTFQGGADGFTPAGSLIADSNGNLYGVTSDGGPVRDPDDGTVFELSPPTTPGGAWTKTTLYTFQPFPAKAPLGDAFAPYGVAFDPQGNLIGAAQEGGYCQQFEGGSCFGAVFEVSPPAQTGGVWSEKLLYRFNELTQNPAAGVVIDSAGVVYGASYEGVYKLNSGRFSVLLSFTDTNGLGGYPWSGVIVGPAGNLFGIAQGGTCCGAVFELRPPAHGVGSWTETTLYNFLGSAAADAELPNTPLLLGADGNLYGTSWRGGSQGCQYYGSVGCGTVFQVVP